VEVVLALIANSIPADDESSMKGLSRSRLLPYLAKAAAWCRQQRNNAGMAWLALKPPLARGAVR
jgi:hypothetical protein